MADDETEIRKFLAERGVTDAVLARGCDTALAAEPGHMTDRVANIVNGEAESFCISHECPVDRTGRLACIRPSQNGHHSRSAALRYPIGQIRMN